MRYYSILTSLGKVAVSNAIALDTKVDFAYIGYGDGGGSEYEPSENQTELRGFKHKSRVYDIIVIEENSQIEIQGLIPSTVGGFVAREVGIYDSSNRLLLIAKIPESSKPLLEEGSGVDLFLKIRLEVSNTNIVNLTVDPSALLVNINQFNQYKGEMNDLYLNLKAQVEEALSGGELEGMIIQVGTDLEDHTNKGITKDEVHGFSLITEELYRNTDSDGKVPIKTDIKNVKGKATTEEAKEGSDDEKYMTPKKVKDFLLHFGDGSLLLFDSGLTAATGWNTGKESNSSTTNWIVNKQISDIVGFEVSSMAAQTSPNSNVFIISTSKIDLTEYNYIEFEGVEFRNSGGNWRVFTQPIKLGVSTNENFTETFQSYGEFVEDIRQPDQSYPDTKIMATIKANISQLTGEHYVKIGFKVRRVDHGGGAIGTYKAGIRRIVLTR